MGILFNKIYKLKSVDSTHLLAIRLVEDNNECNCIITAEQQSAGIGRCGRFWLSPVGNLFLSIITDIPSADLGQVSLAISCAIHETISHFLSTDNLFLHWPNDIYYKNMKISGILLSTVNGRLIISVGVNVNTAPDLESSMSMKQVSQHEFDVQCVIEIAVEKIQQWLTLLSLHGFKPVKDYWSEYINFLYDNISIKNGIETLSGICMGINETGRLILQCADRKLLISSGDMFINEKGITVNYE